ncbi:MAG TPA: lysozyme inhibitor LprI family protein [Edaphobacter sp.]|nr:lysozyme inhibitor LprI family protein [Edaphobacter sp.]
MTASFIANCAVAISASGQVSPAELPADCSAYVSVPPPIEAEATPFPKTYPACASYRSYRGIGRLVNYSEARTCAWQERLAQKAGLEQNQKEPTAWVVGGSLILADIYFNGAGVKRNTSLAIRLACESEEGMAKLALPEIAKLNGSARAHKNFEFCDYAVTTFTQNFCSGYASEIQEDHKNRYYSSLQSSMIPEQQAAFKRLLTTQNAFIEAHASEVYQGGSIHNIRTLGSQEILNNLFHADITHFERQKCPPLFCRSNHNGRRLTASRI